MARMKPQRARRKPSVSDIRSTQAYADALDFIAQRIEASSTPPVFGQLDLRPSEKPREAYQIERIIPMNGVGLIYGPYAYRPISVAIDIAFHIAAGMDWHSVSETRKGNVIIITGDASLADLSDAAQDWLSAAFPVDEDYTDEERKPFLRAMANLRRIRAFDYKNHFPKLSFGTGDRLFQSILNHISFENMKPSLFVIDGIGMGEEGSSWKGFMESARYLSTKFHSAVLLTLDEYPFPDRNPEIRGILPIADFAYSIAPRYPDRTADGSYVDLLRLTCRKGSSDNQMRSIYLELRKNGSALPLVAYAKEEKSR